MSVSAEKPGGTQPNLLGVGAAWLSVSSRGGRAAGTLVEALGAARKRGWRCGLLGLRGGDAAGSRLARGIVARGLDDLGVVYLDRPTPVSHPATGCADPAFGLFEFGMPKQLRRRHFRDAAAQADAVLVDTSLPAAALTRVLDTAAMPVLVVESEVGDAARLLPLLPRLHAVVVRETTLRRILDLSPTASLGTLSTAIGRYGARVLVAIGEPLGYRFSGGAFTLSGRPVRRGASLADAVAAELDALR
ncbi:MAG: hypothetical protein KF849_08980 [Rhizobiaceae bacterium]|nr:hypothetical protein [Rhizobiaceae bacterium]